MKSIAKKAGRLLITALVVLSLHSACSDSSTTPIPVFTSMSVSFTGFDSLKTELYEAWVVTNGQYTSLGKFNLRFNGAAVDTLGVGFSGFSFPGEISSPSRLAITVEPVPDTDTGPSPIEVLTGNVADVASGQLTLSFMYPFSGRKSRGGNFILISPSDGGGHTFLDDGPDVTNGVSGLWFISKSWGSPEPGLFFDSLAPSGWMYEGWLLYPGFGFVSTGKFSDGVKGDNSANYYSTAGFDTAFHYPGEDFFMNPPTGLTFPLDVRGTSPGAMCFITLEPEPDNSPMPFMAPKMPFILYCSDIVDTMKSNAVYPLTMPDFGSATATLK